MAFTCHHPRPVTSPARDLPAPPGVSTSRRRVKVFASLPLSAKTGRSLLTLHFDELLATWIGAAHWHARKLDVSNGTEHAVQQHVGEVDRAQQGLFATSVARIPIRANETEWAARDPQSSTATAALALKGYGLSVRGGDGDPPDGIPDVVCD